MKGRLKCAAFVVIISFIIISSFLYLNPLEKWQWHKEQAEMTNGDIVVYSQWSDRFMWRGSTIFTLYKDGAGRNILTCETNRYRKEINIDFEMIVSKLFVNNEPYNDVKKKELLADEYVKSDYFFSNDYSKTKEKYFLYVLNDEYLISNCAEEITGGFRSVGVYDIKTHEPYIYPKAIIANKPKNTIIDPERLIEPRYFMDSNGRLLCFYKFYNKIYCHRLN